MTSLRATLWILRPIQALEFTDTNEEVCPRHIGDIIKPDVQRSKEYFSKQKCILGHFRVGSHENKISFALLSCFKDKTLDSVQMWCGAGQAFPAGVGEASLFSSRKNGLSCAMGQANDVYSSGASL